MTRYAGVSVKGQEVNRPKPSARRSPFLPGHVAVAGCRFAAARVWLVVLYLNSRLLFRLAFPQIRRAYAAFHLQLIMRLMAQVLAREVLYAPKM